MANQTVVVWKEGRLFEGTSNGITILMESVPPGTTPRGIGPMSLVLNAFGGCAAIDVADILEKERQEMTGLTIELTGERSPQPPMVYTEIEVTFKVRGRGLTRAAVERAVQLSLEKYCSVGVMLGKTARIIPHIVIETE